MIQTSLGARIASPSGRICLSNPVNIPIRNLAYRITDKSFLVIFAAPRAGLNAGLVRFSFGTPPPLPPVRCSPVLGAVQALRRRMDAREVRSPSLVRPSKLYERNLPMAGRHSLRVKRAERAAHRRATELVDAHTLTAHLLTDAAVAAGQLPKGATLLSAVKRYYL